ncbi:MAG: 50S ribosomal protein L1 [Methylacidiphilales bacterium]|nr:50S ribosomal protein L1 [Candidatus Methylacidiphilales bacterium]
MATKRSKRYKKAAELIDKKKSYALKDAVQLLKKLPSGKSDETVELSFNLGVDPRQSDQMVRGTVALPNGSGQKVRILVFAKGQAADAARNAGADYVGFEDLIKKINEGFQDFDVAVATPEAMIEVRKLGKVLGPRGLMPNPKTGTVTEDTAKAVQECKAGRVEFKIDKTSNISVVCGKISFDEAKLEQNVAAVLQAVSRAKPSSSKGRYIQTCVLSSTYSPAISVDAESVAAAN